jgi:predicted  nucleic acid-binding Zn-ribbon protein
MTASLFDLTGDALLLQRQIDDTAERLFSEDPADVAAATEALEQLITAEANNRAALASKADAWCWVIDSLRSQATARREHAHRLRELADHAERRAEALQDQLVAALGRVDPDATKWELPSHKLTSRRTTAVELDPDLAPEDLPEQFRRTRTVTSADRIALAAALKAGAAIDGAQLVERRSWKIA